MRKMVAAEVWIIEAVGYTFEPFFSIGQPRPNLPDTAISASIKPVALTE